MEQVVIVDAVRTPMGRSKGGAFRHVRAEDLSAHLMRSLLSRNPSLEASTIDDIYWGCVQQTLEQGFNIARNAALLAEIPHSVPATTVNRLCGSSMQALHDAARMIMTGDATVCLIGGVEHMGHVPMSHGVDFHPGLSRNVAKAAGMMGLTAEMLARLHGISREMQDQLALASQQRAAAAIAAGYFKEQIVPVEIATRKGTVLFQEDEHVRAATTLDVLAGMKPAFKKDGGTVTAGNASGINDGAAAVVLAAGDRVAALGLKPLARLVGYAHAGVDPAYMGIGPVPATQKVLQRTGLKVQDMDVIEANEAFAAQACAVVQELGLQPSKVNPNGSGISLGHPVGATGAIITTKAIAELHRTGGRYALVTMCIGGGQGIAAIFERV